MNSIKKAEIDSLKHSLKCARRKFGKDSKEVFKIIKKQLKIINPSKYDSDGSVEIWENYTLRSGSFCHLNI